MTRLFIAVPVPEIIRSELASLKADIAGARWVAPEKMHLTLRFLGDSADEQIGAVSAALAAIEGPAVSIRIEGTGVFGGLRNPRVLFARVEANPGLISLQKEVEAAAVLAGFEPDEKAYRPHVTLARLRLPDRQAVRAFVEQTTISASYTADAFHLVASLFKSGGHHYEVLNRYRLSA